MRLLGGLTMVNNSPWDGWTGAPGLTDAVARQVEWPATSGMPRRSAPAQRLPRRGRNGGLVRMPRPAGSTDR